MYSKLRDKIVHEILMENYLDKYDYNTTVRIVNKVCEEEDKEESKETIGEATEIHNGFGGGQVSETIDANYHKGWLDHGQRTHIKDGSGGGRGSMTKKHTWDLVSVCPSSLQGDQINDKMEEDLKTTEKICSH